LESEDGPEQTIIDASDFGFGLLCWDGEDIRTIIRGFTFVDDWNGINIGTPSSISIYNCIFEGSPRYGIWMGDTNSRIYNCIFSGCGIAGISFGYSFGIMENSIYIDNAYGIEMTRLWELTVTYGWNLFWNNDLSNYRRLEMSDTDLEEDPIFIEGSYVPSEDSPAINAGDPRILDLDGTRSDIGVYGGPYAY